MEVDDEVSVVAPLTRDMMFYLQVKMEISLSASLF